MLHNVMPFVGISCFFVQVAMYKRLYEEEHKLRTSSNTLLESIPGSLIILPFPFYSLFLKSSYYYVDFFWLLGVH